MRPWDTNRTLNEMSANNSLKVNDVMLRYLASLLC